MHINVSECPSARTATALLAVGVYWAAFSVCLPPTAAAQQALSLRQTAITVTHGVLHVTLGNAATRSSATLASSPCPKYSMRKASIGTSLTDRSSFAFTSMSPPRDLT